MASTLPQSVARHENVNQRAADASISVTLTMTQLRQPAAQVTLGDADDPGGVSGRK
jgi:hypothetical protein